MTQRTYVRYKILTIYQKIGITLRISIDPRVEFRNSTESYNSVSLTLYPSVEFQILREQPRDDSGRAVRMWNPDDSFSLSKFYLPLFLKDVMSVYEALKISEMYVYTGERLDLNQKLANEKRRIFQASNSCYIEIVPTVLEYEGKRVEGIRFTINKETSSFSLSLVELEAFIYTLKKLDVDLLALMMYQHYSKTGSTNITNPFPM